MLTPRDYLSYSQKSLWKSSPKGYVDRYIHGKTFESKETRYGHMMADALEHDTETMDPMLDIMIAQIPKFELMDQPPRSERGNLHWTHRALPHQADHGRHHHRDERHGQGVAGDPRGMPTPTTMKRRRMSNKSTNKVLDKMKARAMRGFAEHGITAVRVGKKVIGTYEPFPCENQDSHKRKRSSTSSGKPENRTRTNTCLRGNL